MEKLRVNGQRLWDSLMEMGEIGGTEKGGCNRLAATDLDKQARDLFCDWCKATGCDIAIDKFGNIFAKRPGLNTDLPAVDTGSERDTQPTRRKLTGVFGRRFGV